MHLIHSSYLFITRLPSKRIDEKKKRYETISYDNDRNSEYKYCSIFQVIENIRQTWEHWWRAITFMLPSPNSLPSPLSFHSHLIH